MGSTRVLGRASRAEPLRLGIVGCGFVAEQRHLPTLRRLPEIQVEALADVDLERCRRVAARFGVPKSYASARELLDHGRVEAVAVCTPASAHAEPALAALDAGKHVFVEKPLALTLEDAGTLVERAETSSGVTMVGFNLRWHRLVRQARELLREGRIGRVTAIATRYTDERIQQRALPAWRYRRELGGGALIEKVIHHFDLWRFLLGDEVDEVFAVGVDGRGEDQVTMVTGRMRRGALAHACGSDLTAASNEVRVDGEEGALHLDLYRFDGLALSSLSDLPGAPLTRARRGLSSVKQLATGLREIREGGSFDATYAAEWRHFASAARAKGRPDPTFDDGLRAVQIALAAARSTSAGSPQSVANVEVSG